MRHFTPRHLATALVLLAVCLFADLIATPFDDLSMRSHRARSVRLVRGDTDHDSAAPITLDAFAGLPARSAFVLPSPDCVKDTPRLPEQRVVAPCPSQKFGSRAPPQA
jgi:hypothetical protein